MEERKRDGGRERRRREREMKVERDGGGPER